MKYINIGHCYYTNMYINIILICNNLLLFVLLLFRIYKYKDTISFWTLLDDNARNKSIKLPESSAVLQIVNSWMQNKNYPLVKLQIDGDDLVIKQVTHLVQTL